MSWDDDWREAKRQREEEDYDRWWAEREAERDAEVGRYSRPMFSQEAWETYDRVWNERDADNRSWEASRQQDEQRWDTHDTDAAPWGFDNTPDLFDGERWRLTDTSGRSTTMQPSSGTSSDGEVIWGIGVTAVLMLLAITSFGFLGLLACFFGWQIFLFVGWMIGSAIAGAIKQ